MKWLILTGEYPPSEGGVADYTASVAEALAARGEDVIVFAPAPHNSQEISEVRNRIQMEWLPGLGIYAQWTLFHKLAIQSKDSILLLQYVPHAFRWKGMNVLLCILLYYYKSTRFWIMFHEVAFPIEPNQGWRHRLLAHANRWMVRLLCRSKSLDRMMISTESWRPLLQDILGRRVTADWFPVPSNLEIQENLAHRLTKPLTKPIILGHFGTFGRFIGDILRKIIPVLLTEFPDIEMILIGRGSKEYLRDVSNQYPITDGRVEATGELSKTGLRTELARCDILIQPFPDGISTRRTSAMAGLELGIPIITQRGHLTEEFWNDSAAVTVIDGENTDAWLVAIRELVNSGEKRLELGRRGRELYEKRFSLKATIDALVEGSRNPTV